MRRIASLLALTLLSPGALALNPQVAPFVPKGFRVLEGKALDLDGDSLPDRLLVLENAADPDGERSLLILMGTRQGFRLGARADDLVLCRECGGMMGDPYWGMQAGRGWFRLSQSGGSAFRWGFSHTFGLRDGRWLLTALDEGTFNVNDPDSERSYSIPPAECQNIELTQFVCGVDAPSHLEKAVVRSPRAYFHTAPDAQERGSAYVVAGQRVSVYTVYRTFVEASYVAADGRETGGFIRRADLSGF